MTEMTEAVLRTCGVRIDPVTMDQAVAAILSAARDGRPLATHLVNAYTLSLAVRDEGFGELLDRGDLNLPDGMPLIWLGRRAGLTHLTSRVYGPELMGHVVDRGQAQGLRHYLYGGTAEVVEQLATGLRDRYREVDIVGVESPPFRPLAADEETDLVERVAASGAQVMWVGLGTPKQDVFVDRFRDRLGIPVLAIGAAFDFLSDTKRMAPRWMQQRGLEWLYRLVSEPRRLWKRYLVGNTIFIWGALRSTRVERRIQPGSSEG